MTLSSMTGFARFDGGHADYGWSWEIKTVNAKGLDLRFRLPQGLDALEPQLRAAIASTFARGSCQIGLTLKSKPVATAVRINHAVLDMLMEAMAEASQRLEAAPPRLDGLFAVRGVVEVEEAGQTDLAALHAPLLADFEKTLAACAGMRRNEGQALAKILSERLAEIETLTQAAEHNPVRRPEAIRDKLAAQIKTVIDAAPMLGHDRLYQEALLIAAKVDIREELDRLYAHLAAAHALVSTGGPVGRKLDFLAQEFNREVNTLCSKSNDLSLTATGLSLKAVVEQFREQVQNIE